MVMPRACMTMGLGAALLIASASHEGRAAAEIDPVALMWNAPAGCPTGAAVHDRIETSLGPSPSELAPVAAVVNVSEPSAGRWQAVLALFTRGERAERTFEAETCEALATATTLIVALAAEGPRPNRPLPPAVAASLPPPRDVAEPWDSRRALAQLEFSLDDGTMPRSAAPGIAALFGASWSWGRPRLRLLGGPGLLLPQDAGPLYGIDGNQSVGHYWAYTLSGRGCFTVAASGFEVGPCLGGELAVMHGTSIGGTEQGTQDWLSALGALMGAVSVSSNVVVFGHLDAVLPGTRRTFMGAPVNVGSYNPVFTISSHALRGAVGIELRVF